jgi:phenylacetic acid degradation operon negative regulatory protein
VAPSPRSLVLDLISTLGGESMPVGALVAAGALFGIPENAMRVAITRLLATGALARDERGRYRLGPAAAPLGERVVSWRRLEDRVGRWQGRWVAVHGAGPSRGRGKAAARAARALRLLGFASFGRDLALRPDNLRRGVAGVREELLALGLPAGTEVFALSELDAGAEARARSLWDTAALRAGYARSRLALAKSEARLARATEEAAMAESFRLGGRVIRELVSDPLLPEPLLPAAERRALVAAMRRYDRVGRRIWAGFMARYGAPHAALPADGLAVAFARGAG